MKTKRLIFDIETGANPENIALMPAPKIEAPSNYKDPQKIAEYIAEKTAQAQADLIERAALDADLGKILSIGMRVTTSPLDGDVRVYVNEDVYGTDAPGAMREDVMLSMFWQTLWQCNGYCIGFNVLGFDLPYLMRRSFALGLSVPAAPNLAKFRTDPVTDLMAILYNWGSDRYKGLKTIARLYNLPIECPEADGSQVATMTVDELIAYQRSDVLLTESLYAKMNGVYFRHN